MKTFTEKRGLGSGGGGGRGGGGGGLRSGAIRMISRGSGTRKR